MGEFRPLANNFTYGVTRLAKSEPSSGTRILLYMRVHHFSYGLNHCLKVLPVEQLGKVAQPCGKSSLGLMLRA